MGTLCQFLALINDLLPDGSFSHVTQIFIGQTDSVLRLVRLREKDSRAMFAYRLEYTNDAPEVSHVKNRQLQIHVTKMPDARIYVFTASLTRRFFRVCSLKPTVGSKFAKNVCDLRVFYQGLHMGSGCVGRLGCTNFLQRREYETAAASILHSRRRNLRAS
jgi:hypothetical protein